MNTFLTFYFLCGLLHITYLWMPGHGLPPAEGPFELGFTILILLLFGPLLFGSGLIVMIGCMLWDLIDGL